MSTFEKGSINIKKLDLEQNQSGMYLNMIHILDMLLESITKNSKPNVKKSINNIISLYMEAMNKKSELIPPAKSSTDWFDVEKKLENLDNIKLSADKANDKLTEMIKYTDIDFASINKKICEQLCEYILGEKDDNFVSILEKYIFERLNFTDKSITREEYGKIGSQFGNIKNEILSHLNTKDLIIKEYIILLDKYFDDIIFSQNTDNILKTVNTKFDSLVDNFFESLNYLDLDSFWENISENLAEDYDRFCSKKKKKTEDLGIPDAETIINRTSTRKDLNKANIRKSLKNIGWISKTEGLLSNEEDIKNLKTSINNIYKKIIDKETTVNEKVYFLSVYLNIFAEIDLKLYKSKLSQSNEKNENAPSDIESKITEMVCRNLSFDKDSYSLYLLLNKFYNSFDNSPENKVFFRDFLEKLSKFRTKTTSSITNKYYKWNDFETQLDTFGGLLTFESKEEMQEYFKFFMAFLYNTSSIDIEKLTNVGLLELDNDFDKFVDELPTMVNNLASVNQDIETEIEQKDKGYFNTVEKKLFGEYLLKNIKNFQEELLQENNVNFYMTFVGETILKNYHSRNIDENLSYKIWYNNLPNKEKSQIIKNNFLNLSKTEKKQKIDKIYQSFIDKKIKSYLEKSYGKKSKNTNATNTYSSPFANITLDMDGIFWEIQFRIEEKKQISDIIDNYIEKGKTSKIKVLTDSSIVKQGERMDKIRLIKEKGEKIDKIILMREQLKSYLLIINSKIEKIKDILERNNLEDNRKSYFEKQLDFNISIQSEFKDIIEEIEKFNIYYKKSFLPEGSSIDGKIYSKYSHIIDQFNFSGRVKQVKFDSERTLGTFVSDMLNINDGFNHYGYKLQMLMKVNYENNFKNLMTIKPDKKNKLNSEFKDFFYSQIDGISNKIYENFVDMEYNGNNELLKIPNGGKIVLGYTKEELLFHIKRTLILQVWNGIKNYLPNEIEKEVAEKYNLEKKLKK